MIIIEELYGMHPWKLRSSTYMCIDDTVDRLINSVQQTHKETTEQSIWIRQWLHHVAVVCHCDLA